MDLIAAHRHGLADQIIAEGAGLAGRAGDGVQRAILLHHLYDHSGGRHGYALLAADCSLALGPALERMARAARRARWRLGTARRDALLERIEEFGAALREVERARAAALWSAHRGAQRAATAALVPAELVGFAGEADGRALFLAHQGWAEARWGVEIEAAVTALDWPLGAGAPRAALAAVRIALDRYEAAARGGLRRSERRLLADPRLPAGFAANPAQHYYALQRQVAARRRREEARLGGVPVEETVRLAAAA